MGKELLPTGFFEGIDFIVPVPLARQRVRQRGYNQSEMLAQGISQITGLKVKRKLIRRIVNTEKLKEIGNQTLPYTKFQVTVAATLSAPFFSIMFGGNVYDAFGAAIATLFGFAFSLYVEKFVRIPFVTAFAGAFVFGLIAQFWARYTGFPSTADLIIAGAVMPFVPGIALTNAVRDIMTNHINSGMSKMFESLLITLALGAGTSVALVLMT